MRARLKTFLEPPEKPPRGIFPGRAKVLSGMASAPPSFPGKGALSNVPIAVPLHFMGRVEALAAIETALQRNEGRAAITVLHGMRGVGKTTLAAAYAGDHRSDYRATWWIKAQTEPTLRADLIGLGIRLGWVGADDKEEPGIEAVMERLRHEGDGILLIFNHAVDVDALKPYLPGREAERTAAENLSEALAGLPLAHEQAAAYCERLDISLADYCKRFETTPGRYLGDGRYAPAEYHDGLTVAKTFALAIEEAAKLHPAAEPLIVHTALLAPEPIPLFLFAEAREKLGEPMAITLADDGLDEAVAVLRTFALIERETIADERDTAVTTDAIRLHRLVREVAAARREGETRDELRCALVAALEAVYPASGWENPTLCSRCAPLTPHLLPICQPEMA